MNLDASANRLVNLEVIVKDRSNASVVVLERKFHAGLINFGQTIEGIKDSIRFICLSKQIPSFVIDTIEVRTISGEYCVLNAEFDFHTLFDADDKKRRGSLKPHAIRILGVSDADSEIEGNDVGVGEIDEQSSGLPKPKKDRRSTSASHCRRGPQSSNRSVSRPRNEPENTTRNQSPCRPKIADPEVKVEEKPATLPIRSCANVPIRTRKLAPDCDAGSNVPASPSRPIRPTAKARPASPFKLARQTPVKQATVASVKQEEPVLQNDKIRSLENRSESLEVKKEKEDDICLDKSADDLSVSSGNSDVNNAGVSSRKRAPSPSKQATGAWDEKMTPRVEAQVSWEGTLRSGRSARQESVTKSARGAKNLSSAAKEKSDDFASLMTSGSKRNGTLRVGQDGDARPSYGTLYELFETLKTAMNVDDEEVQWISASKGANGFEYAEEKEAMAEDNYYRWTWEQESRQVAVKRLNNPVLNQTLENIRKFHEDWQELGRIRVLSVNVDDADSNPQTAQKAKLEDLEASVVAAQAKLIVFAEEEELKDFPEEAEIGDLLKKVSTAEMVKAGRRALIAQRKIEENVQSLKEFAVKCQSRIDNFVGTMEKWRERKERLQCYDEEMAKRERRWINDNRARNNAALEKMRSLIPVRIASLSLKDLVQEYEENRVFCPKSLSCYLKDTKIFHWLVIHPDDIQSSNFLSGEHSHSFTQLDKYDIVEMRAIAAILPERFDLDRDGKKKEWRRSFFARLTSMSQQELGATVRGGYDGVLRKRKDVALPALDKDKLRRAVYFYPSKESMMDIARKYENAEKRMVEKQRELLNCHDGLTSARKDLNDLVMDMRDASIKNSSISDELSTLKSSQQVRVRELERLSNQLNTEIRSLRSAIDGRTITKGEVEHEISELNKIDMLNTEDLEVKSGGLYPFDVREVPGPFDSLPVIARMEKSSVRKLSAEEERRQRLLELQSSIPKSAKSLETTTSDTFVQDDNNSLKKTLLSSFDDAAVGHASTLLNKGRDSVSCRQIGKITPSEELVRVLGRNFSESKLSTPAFVRSSSSTLLCASASVEGLKSPSKLQPKSRLVQQLIQRKLSERSNGGNDGENAENASSGGRVSDEAPKLHENTPMRRPALGGLSFLDELKRRSKASS